MEYLFIQRQGDREKIMELLIEFKQCSKEELISRYNRTVEVGIVGVHAQAQMIVGLHQAFRTAFGKSPINIVDNAIISLTGKIELVGEDWQYSINPKTE
ncbi:MAG: hypothetical protein NTY55_00800 [Flavobacteriia bacterium]|jgi:hypothetical protein|nr:hypothetical protein [Flavobacteriia bacterium]